MRYSRSFFYGIYGVERYMLILRFTSLLIILEWDRATVCWTVPLVESRVSEGARVAVEDMLLVVSSGYFFNCIGEITFRIEMEMTFAA